MGVIVGPDLVVENGEVRTVPSARASQDQSIKGYKAMMRSDPEGANALGDLVVKNTYRTLMTRGMKGCYVYCVDTVSPTGFDRDCSKPHLSPNGLNYFQWIGVTVGRLVACEPYRDPISWPFPDARLAPGRTKWHM